MSFSSKTKQELCLLKLKAPCCMKAGLCAMIRMLGSLQLGSQGTRVRMTTESYAVARWGASLAKRLYRVPAEILVRERRRLGKNRSFALVLSGDVEPLLLDTGLMRRTRDGLDMSQSPCVSGLENDCCKRTFLRGAFLSGGTVSHPEKSYHLELVAPNETLAEDVLGLMLEYGLNAKIVERKGSFVVYLKESDSILEFLRLIGAGGASLEMESARTMKDFRNNLNRQVNCETGNISKTVNAAGRQRQCITYLIQTGQFDRLPRDLRETAEARLNNPEATLNELCELLSEPVTKSGINHRLRRIEEIARRLKFEEGEV